LVLTVFFRSGKGSAIKGQPKKNGLGIPYEIDPTSVWESMVFFFRFQHGEPSNPDKSSLLYIPALYLDLQACPAKPLDSFNRQRGQSAALPNLGDSSN
jgi:hypothetical protein